MVLFLGPLYSGKQDAAKAWAESSGKDWANLRVCDDVMAHWNGASEELRQIALNLTEAYDLILYTEVGSGLVPVDETERRYREVSGRLSTMLAEQADEVYRVVAGIPKRLK